MNRLMRKIILQKIVEKGSLNFADFMQEVLYNPQAGYYTTKTNIFGKHGDFYTSAHVKNILGEVLAEVFINEAQEKQYYFVLEYGAGEGFITKCFLDYVLTNSPTLYNKIRLFIVEISEKLREAQKITLEKHLEKVRWINSIGEIKPFNGMIYCNEFLDALPVHVLKYKKSGKIEELFITLNNKKIVKKYSVLSENVQNYSKFLPDLPCGAITEFSPQALNWLKNIAMNSNNCSVYIIDYGYTLEQKKMPQRIRNSSIRCFKNHRVFKNYLADVGDRDITADVDFSTLINFAKHVGMEKEFLWSQTKFVFKSGYLEKANSIGQNSVAIKQIVFPGAMGEVFDVLKFVKNSSEIVSKN